MTDNDREEIIAMLVLWTGWAKSAFEKMTDEELLTEFDRRVGEQ